MKMNKVTSMGGKRDFEQLQSLYDKIDQTAFGDRPDIPSLRTSTGDADLDAKYMVQDMMAFFLLRSMEVKAAPETMLFATELFALNVFNAKDCPLPMNKRNEVRERAYKYYSENLVKVPDK